VVSGHALFPVSDQPHVHWGFGVGVAAEGWLSKNVALGGSLELTKFIVDQYFYFDALSPVVTDYHASFLPRLSGTVRVAPVDLAKGVYVGVSLDAIASHISYKFSTFGENVSSKKAFAGVSPSVGLRWKALDVGLRYQYVANEAGDSFLGLVVGGQAAAF
jgi:hypothetical protein